jgi:hypothetical protein
MVDPLASDRQSSRRGADERKNDLHYAEKISTDDRATSSLSGFVRWDPRPPVEVAP